MFNVLDKKARVVRQEGKKARVLDKRARRHVRQEGKNVFNVVRTPRTTFPMGLRSTLFLHRPTLGLGFVLGFDTLL